MYNRAPLLLLMAIVCMQAMAAVPGLINYSGRLTDPVGVPVTAATSVTFTFWSAPTGGSQLGAGYSSQVTVTPNMDGVYSVQIGKDNPVPAEIFDSPEVWLNVNMGGQDLAPRARITSTGYAFRADAADTARQLQGGAYVMPQTTGTPIQNGESLLAAYARAKMLTPGGQPLTTTTRATVLVPPGEYDLATKSLIMDAEFVDLVGLSSARTNQYIYGTASGQNTGVVRQTANNVRIENLTIKCTADSGNITFTASDPAAYFPDNNKPATYIRNCEFWANTAFPTRLGTIYSGTYQDCTGGNYLFGANGGTASGMFTNCIGGANAFGGYYGTASGTFTNCTGGASAFGGFHGTASGTFTNCTAADYSFGGNAGTANGKFTDCTGANYSFGGHGTASGTFANCRGADFSFGGYIGTASGAFTNCTGGIGAFGGNGGTAGGGKFYYCQGGPGSFTTSGLPAPVHRFCLRDGNVFP